MTGFKTYTDGVYNYGGDWEYDSNKLDKTGLSSNFSSGNTFSGKANKNVAVKYNGSSGWFANYAYTFGNDGYAISSTTTVSNGVSYKYFFKFE